MKTENIVFTREYREKLLNDPYRPTYHFAFPDKDGRPGDPNGAFFADGKYHLMYLYKSSSTGGYHWGHVSSVDLLHWQHHEDALTVHEGDGGCYSGGGFVDDDKTAYLSFWKFPAIDPEKDKSGIALARSTPPYEKWERMEPIAINASYWGVKDIEIDGKTVHLGCSDPSNIWKANGYYYMQLGALCVLEVFGRAENSPIEYQGGWTELFRSKDLKNWEFVHRFYDNTHTGENGFPDRTEDDMCPSFLPLYDKRKNGKKTDKWLQLFIAHNRGCQYFVGEFQNERLKIEKHGRMSWKDIAYFAPEALIDDKNRHIVFTWLKDNLKDDFEQFGWSGVFAFPRLVWWENEELRMAPAEELERLHLPDPAKLEADGSISVKNGESFRIKATFSGGEEMGFRLRESLVDNEYTDVYVDRKAGTLVVDTTNSGLGEWKIKEEAPFHLNENEELNLDIFVDKSVVEVYANERQAICRRVYPSQPKLAVGVRLLGEKDALKALKVYEIAPANPY